MKKKKLLKSITITFFSIVGLLFFMGMLPSKVKIQNDETNKNVYKDKNKYRKGNTTIANIKNKNIIVDTSLTLFLRVTVQDPDPQDFDSLFVRSCYIGGRRAVAKMQERQHLIPFPDKPGGRTHWFELPVKKQKVPYSGVTLYVGPNLEHDRLSNYESTIGRIVLQAELAVAPSVNQIDSICLLRPVLVHGNGVPFYYEGGSLTGIPERATWLIDHLNSLHRGLVEAGFSSNVNINPSRMRLGILLSNSRYGAGPYDVLSRDPDIYWLYGDIFALAGYNVGTRGRMLELYENHTRFRFNMVPVAESGQELPADFLPHGLTIPVQVDEQYRKDAEKARKGDGLVQLWMKLGDEIHVQEWQDTPRARKILLQEAKIVTKDDPSRLGLGDWMELEPVTATDPDKVAGEDRLKYYITLRAQNILSAEYYAVRTAAKWKHFGEKPLTEVNMLGPMYYGGYSAQFWWRETPDYFRMADLRAVDVLQVQGLNSAYPPGGPLALSLLSPKVAAQAASRNQYVEPEVMHFASRTPPEAWEHVTFSTIISGVFNIDWYQFGPRASGWEWFDEPDKVLKHAQLFRKLEKTVPYLPEKPTPGKAKVALLWAESSDLWQRHPCSYSKSELRSTFYALRFSGFEADMIREYMVENGELDGYKILFVSQRNINRKVQKSILDWIRNGGTLVLTPGSMTHDASNRPANILSDLLSPAITWTFDESQQEGSGEFSDFPELTRVNWNLGQTSLKELPVYFHKQVIDGKAKKIAEFKIEGNSRTAGRIMSYGDGKVIALGFFPGHSYTEGSAKSRIEKKVDSENPIPLENEVKQGIVRTGSPYWMVPNEKARKLIAGIVEHAGVNPQVTVDKPTIDSGLFIKDKRAAVLLSNYQPHPRGKVSVKTTLPERFKNAIAHDLSGKEIELEWTDSEKVQFSVELNEVQTVCIEIK